MKYVSSWGSIHTTGNWGFSIRWPRIAAVISVLIDHHEIVRSVTIKQLRKLQQPSKKQNKIKTTVDESVGATVFHADFN